MNGTTGIVVAFAAGGGLGTVFFAGLWWTVNRMAHSGRPTTLLAGSFLLRMTVALAGFYVAARAGWKPLSACLLGFMVARAITAWLGRPHGSAARPAPLVP